MILDYLRREVQLAQSWPCGEKWGIGKSSANALREPFVSYLEKGWLAKLWLVV